MKRAALRAILAACAGCLIFGQSTDSRPKFVIADVHAAAAGSINQRIIPVHDGRYELTGASMVDLIRIAYGFDADKILGGPTWLEMNRYDIAAKLPGETSPDDQKLMLQTLLEDRFKLVVRKETKPLPGYVLTAGKKPSLKEAAGTEESGCTPQASSGPAPEGGVRLMMGSTNASGQTQTTTIVLGPGGVIRYNCRNITMAAFASGLRNMLGASVGTSPVADETGLTGKYDFDLSFSIGLVLNGQGSDAPNVTVFDAIDKLGLKLEKKDIPTPVIVVDSVNQKPSDNPPDLTKEMPPMPPATVFDVASIKAADPSARSARFQALPGGRFVVENYPMSSLIMMALRDPLATFGPISQPKGLPGWANSARFDITAKAPAGAAPLDTFTVAIPLRALLVDRFKLTYHTEQQPGTSYTLQAVKPKLKKADSAERTTCKQSSSAGPPRTMTFQCQNMTMPQLADYVSARRMLSGPVTDATGLEGSWDFTLTYSPNLPSAQPTALGGAAGQPGAEAPAAADPTGGYTMFEAIEKQLGLKLVEGKSPQPVIVIDHLEEKPTEDQ
jgi:uncharacterized protein (TIGR03435 family)